MAAAPVAGADRGDGRGGAGGGPAGDAPGGGAAVRRPRLGAVGVAAGDLDDAVRALDDRATPSSRSRGSSTSTGACADQHGRRDPAQPQAAAARVVRRARPARPRRRCAGTPRPRRPGRCRRCARRRRRGSCSGCGTSVRAARGRSPRAPRRRPADVEGVPHRGLGEAVDGRAAPRLDVGDRAPGRGPATPRAGRGRPR